MTLPQITNPEQIAESALGKPVLDSSGNQIGSITECAASKDGMIVTIQLNDGCIQSIRVL